MERDPLSPSFMASALLPDTASAIPSTASAPPPQGYSRATLEKNLQDGFRQQQRAARERRIEHVALAKGLGELAVASLKDGIYNPRKVLPPLKPEEKKVFDRMDYTDWRMACQRRASAEDALGGGAAAASAVVPAVELTEVVRKASTPVSGTNGQIPDGAAKQHSARSSTLSSWKGDSNDDSAGPMKAFLHQLHVTSRAAASLKDVQAEMEANIDMVEAALSHQCAPLAFSELLEAISRTLEAMERGRLDEDLRVPDCRTGDATPVPTFHNVNSEEDDEKKRGPGSAETEEAGSSTARTTSAAVPTILLHGAVEVEWYTRTFLLPKAYNAIAVAHAAEWMLQYTMAYLRATEARNTEEANLRLMLLARCVRLLGDIENFSSALLSLEAKSEEYTGFDALRDTAEEHLSSLLEEVEEALDAVMSVPFPSRRSRLLLVERGVKTKLHRALLLLNEIDYSWTPTAHFHWLWKVEFLTLVFRRIHGPIAHKHMQCSMGFIDDSLYDPVSDTRITGRYMGASPVQPRVQRAQQVEYERVTEKLTLQQIGVSVKGVASLVVGTQVCMGSRYLLHQSTSAFDHLWGFPMDEVNNAPTAAEELQKKVAKVVAKAKQQFSSQQPVRDKSQRSATFLTQDE